MEVYNETQRIKFVPSKPIETNGKEVKPCIVVFKNKAYRISSWKEFYKIAYYNNVKSNNKMNFQKFIKLLYYDSVNNEFYKNILEDIEKIKEENNEDIVEITENIDIIGKRLNDFLII